MDRVIITTSIIAIVLVLAVAFMYNASITGLFVASAVDKSATILALLGFLVLGVVMSITWNR